MKSGLRGRLGMSAPTIAPETDGRRGRQGPGTWEISPTVPSPQMPWVGMGVTTATAMPVISEVINVFTAAGAAGRLVSDFNTPCSKTTTDAAPQPVVNRFSMHGCRHWAAVADHVRASPPQDTGHCRSGRGSQPARQQTQPMACQSRWASARLQPVSPGAFLTIPRNTNRHPTKHSPKLNASAPKRPVAKSLSVAGGGPSHFWT